MRGRRAVFLSIAVVMFAACSPAVGSSAPTTSPLSTPSASPVAVASPSAAPTPSATPEPTATPKPTAVPATPVPSAAAGVPPAPTAVKISYKGSDPDGVGYDTLLRTTITWKEAQTAGTEIKVYGVTACLPPDGQDPAPCLVEGTPLPASVRELIVRAPAADGKVSWTWPNWENVGGAVAAHGDTTYEAFVIAAYNATGHSKFIIVVSGEYCSDCTY